MIGRKVISTEQKLNNRFHHDGMLCSIANECFTCIQVHDNGLNRNTSILMYWAVATCASILVSLKPTPNVHTRKETVALPACGSPSHSPICMIWSWQRTANQNLVSFYLSLHSNWSLSPDSSSNDFPLVTMIKDTHYFDLEQSNHHF